jgi:hypothetical protein
MFHLKTSSATFLKKLPLTFNLSLIIKSFPILITLLISFSFNQAFTFLYK